MYVKFVYVTYNADCEAIPVVGMSKLHALGYNVDMRSAVLAISESGDNYITPMSYDEYCKVLNNIGLEMLKGNCLCGLDHIWWDIDEYSTREELLNSIEDFKKRAKEAGVKGEHDDYAKKILAE